MNVENLRRLSRAERMTDQSSSQLSHLGRFHNILAVLKKILRRYLRVLCRPVNKDTIVIDAFLDPVCPYSRDSWPPLKQAVQHYGPRVGLTLCLFPSPSIAFSCYLFSLNSPLEKFYNNPTRNMSRVSVVHHIAMFAAQVIGNSYHNAVHSGFNDDKSGLKTRISFKYAASRGVYGTPSFFINGFFLPHAGSTTNHTCCNSDLLVVSRSES
ncbi:uncharacterized protein LOC121260257 [Juglans microcarpa x Juglans regia]|uniref:uncharacterized protein LOC121260257 n=1 Tax=Juglans microcarpa x Juglans regia TaxID=2249226 RepID=UPI001B7F71C9|nr:uncharacterized protein LOC121260257 [Juglans microcarpa x Juglans regia]